MKLGIMQPYIFPYLGYFQLIQAVDRFIIYDDVAFIKQGWINRNRILVNNKSYTFHIPVKHISSFCNINETLIADKPYNWEKKLFRTLSQSYAKAPYFRQVYPVVEAVISGQHNKSISTVASKSIRVVLEYLEIEKQIVDSSVIYHNSSLKGPQRVIDICRQEGASYYINAIGGMDLYDKKHFQKNNIDLSFIKSSLCTYSQYNSEFIPGLSIIDAMMFCPVDEIRKMLDQYELV